MVVPVGMPGEEADKLENTTTNMNDKVEHKYLYERYKVSLENRAINSEGTFLHLDLSDGKLLCLRQYAEEGLRYEPAASLPVLMGQFDEFRIFSNSGERFRDIFSLERQLTEFHSGNRDTVSYWVYVKPDGQKMELEMVTVLVPNPSNAHIEAIVQLYAKGKKIELDGENARQILFIQKPSPQRETLTLVLAPHFKIETVDTVKQGALMLERGLSFRWQTN